MRRLALLVILVTASLASSSCRTAGRAWRISPFETDSSADRVNLWPLAYHSGDKTSILWPLLDFDKKGFALRPLIAKEQVVTREDVASIQRGIDQMQAGQGRPVQESRADLRKQLGFDSPQ